MLKTFRFSYKTFSNKVFYSQNVAKPLRNTKIKSSRKAVQYFADVKNVQAKGGKGGNGCISFLHLWSNEHAGPDGGDGGNGGHVIFEATGNVKDFTHVPTIIRGNDGEKGYTKDCSGKSAEHNMIKVPVGTVVKNHDNKVIGDLTHDGIMFIAARGGAGGKGNHYFITDTIQAPEICEIGGKGEECEYILEVRSMAHVGLIGFPNAGKSTLLQAISRARPKVASYPFTTLKPHLGIVQYDDYQQLAVADLPGIIADSHKNKGLGIQFLRHIERCKVLLYIVDLSEVEPWQHFSILQNELSQFNSELLERPQLIVGNKIDLPDSETNLEEFKKHTHIELVGVSAKLGLNLTLLLQKIKLLYDQNVQIE